MESSKCGISFVTGILTAVCAWSLLMLADAIDEYVIDAESFLGGAVFFLLPVVMLIVYIIHNRRKNPSGRRILSWFAGYVIAYLPIWYHIFYAVNNRRFFIKQYERSSFLDLNGIEYMLYGFSTLIAFTVCCVFFHVIRLLKKSIKQK